MSATSLPQGNGGSTRAAVGWGSRYVVGIRYLVSAGVGAASSGWGVEVEVGVVGIKAYRLFVRAQGHWEVSRGGSGDLGMRSEVAI